MRSSSPSMCRFRAHGRRSRHARSRNVLSLSYRRLGLRASPSERSRSSQGRPSVRTFDPSPSAPSEDGFRASADWLHAKTPFGSRTDRARLRSIGVRAFPCYLAPLVTSRRRVCSTRNGEPLRAWHSVPLLSSRRPGRARCLASTSANDGCLVHPESHCDSRSRRGLPFGRLELEPAVPGDIAAGEHCGDRVGDQGRQAMDVAQPSCLFAVSRLVARGLRALSRRSSFRGPIGF